MALVLARRMGLVALGVVAVAVLASLTPSPLPAADVKLQDLVGEGAAKTSRVVGEVKAVSAEFHQVGFKIGGASYKNDFNDERWRTECFSYQGMGQLDGKYLDFVYGGDDVIVFCFNGAQAKNGGKMKITATLAANPGDVEISTSADNKDYKRAGTISRLGTLEVDLPPASGDELYLMLDGRAGNGVVVDDFSVVFNAQGPTPTPTPTPTPKPAVQDDRPGRDQPLPGASRGARFEPKENPEGVVRDAKDRSGVVKPAR